MAAIRFEIQNGGQKTQIPAWQTTYHNSGRNIVVPFASFYPKCLADLIFRPQFGFCPLTIAP